MDLKFYLNKFLKADGIEGYTLSSLKALRECYENFLDTTEGTDPDFPLLNFGGKKGRGLRVYQQHNVKPTMNLKLREKK